MFQELAPVLRHRAVLMTITFVEGDQIRVNIVPKKLKDDENNALTTPLTVTGTTEELDADLGRTLVDYVGSHLQLKNTLVQAKAEMDAAAKAAQAEARNKNKGPVKKETSGTSAAKPALPQAAKAAEPAPPPRPQTASLFDMPAADPVTPAPQTQQAESDEDEEDEILSEINEGENEEEEPLDRAA